jgi:hypothetical protein
VRHGVVEGEALVELQSHGGARRAHRRLRRVSDRARARTSGESNTASACTG